MYRKIILTAALLVSTGLGAYFLGDITQKDIIAANAFDRAAAAEPLTAGDLVAVHESGQMPRICNAEVTEADLDNDIRSEMYYNRLARIAAWSATLAEQIGLLEPDKANSLIRAGLPFVGRASSIVEQTYTYKNPEACECAIARTLSQGNRVCAVSASLIETRESVRTADGSVTFRPVNRSVAVTLREHVISLGKPVFEACGVPFTPEANLVQQLSCPLGSSSLPPDVKLRSYLNLITSESFEIVAVSAR